MLRDPDSALDSSERFLEDLPSLPEDERSVVLCTGDVIGVEDLPEALCGEDSGGEVRRGEEDAMMVPFGLTLEEVEKQIIRETLKRTGGDKKTAARLLGIATRTIYRKLDESS